ncbi:hypothetical protein L6R52_28975 [Myxococcota bacterium]|nr:hypothetical protein [Myxococcota bacterium]
MCTAIILGALGVMLAAKLAFHGVARRHAYAHGCGGRGWRRHAYGYGHGACAPDDGPDDGGPGHGGPRAGRGHGRGFGGGGLGRGAERWMLRWLSERLDATPGQEKVIASSLAAMVKVMRDAKGALGDSRGAIGDALRGDDFGHDKLGEAWVAQDQALEKVRLELVTELQKIHEALDDGQRKILADLVAKGAFGP